ncbi:alcohol dehydrogenase catalytic domain-containing protein [Nocardioides sp. HDW12B]|nr:alcohol dehydrogenase catalytic domain-containing protein [Nocardioides sp. HDW12B]
MRAVVYDEIRGTPYVDEVPVPQPPPGGVVVAVEATGLCHSDWHAWAGHDDVTLPHVPGHELAGTVHVVGEGVRGWRVGDRVTSPFVEGCGACSWCAAGQAQVCPDQQQPGFSHWGSFAEQVVIHAADTNLVALPDAVGMHAAAALGCRYATAYRGVVDRARLQRGERVVVVGVGGVGLSVVQIATARGATVVAVDRDEAALELARHHGAAHAIPADPGVDVAAAVHEVTDGGAHVSVDAVGSEQTATAAITSLRRLGRHVQIGLLPAATGRPRLPMDRVIGWELSLLGSHGMAAVDYPAMMALVERGVLRPQDLVRRVVGLQEAAAALPRPDRSTAAGITLIDPRDP